MTSQPDLTKCVESLSLTQIQRHVFICADQTKPLCCSKEAGLAAWNHLKNRLKELKLDAPTIERPNCIFRTKANCLRVCDQGPIMVVYPDGVWYRAASPEIIDRIIQEHLIENKIVQEYAFLTHPLPTPGNSDKTQADRLHSVPNLKADFRKVGEAILDENHQQTAV